VHEPAGIAGGRRAACLGVRPSAQFGPLPVIDAERRLDRQARQVMHHMDRGPAGDAASGQVRTIPIARPRRLDEGYLHHGPGASSLVSGQTGIRPPGSRLLDRARQRVCAVPPPVFTHSPPQSVRYVFLAGAARTAVVRYRMEILAATT
jgi:hypothetical protein